MAIDPASHDPARDRPLRKEWELDNNVIYTEARDPFGFWYVSFKRGQVPETLSGAFTNITLATKAVEKYLEAKGRKPVKAVTKDYLALKTEQE